MCTDICEQTEVETLRLKLLCNLLLKIAGQIIMIKSGITVIKKRTKYW